MGARLADYRIYELDGDGRVSSPARIIQCDDDQDAISQATVLSSGRTIEIWAGERRVGMIPHDR
jgi:hypothetical protein